MSTEKTAKKRSGFTLIELVVVIGILAVLFAIVLIAINPGKQFRAANDTKRRSDVNAILNAVYQYSADQKGALPAGIGTSAADISLATIGAPFCNALVPTYIADLPTDPNNTVGVGCSSFDTGYNIFQSAIGGRVTVSAPHAESGTPISVTR
ncbi:MAG: type II secretion system protein [Candidatus Shapirobacteria bacterium]|nr:type II secretion system protein [Candidatus Shapirobacteria bacterium]